MEGGLLIQRESTPACKRPLLAAGQGSLGEGLILSPAQTQPGSPNIYTGVAAGQAGPFIAPPTVLTPHPPSVPESLQAASRIPSQVQFMQRGISAISISSSKGSEWA